MRSMLSQLIMPLPVFWILATGSLLLYLLKKNKAARRVAGAALVWLLLVSTPFLPEMLVKKLENKLPVFQPSMVKESTPVVHILVLGAGHTDDSRLPFASRLTLSELGRLAEGIRIHRLLPGSILVTSADEGKQKVSQAETAARAAMELGVDSAGIRMQAQPNNTWTEALEFKKQFGDTVGLVLVTSAVHMPRAMYLFQHAGLNPIPAPAAFIVKKGEKRGFWFWMPSSAHLQKMETSIHEYAGLLWYKAGPGN